MNGTVGKHRTWVDLELAQADGTFVVITYDYTWLLLISDRESA